LFAKFWQRLAVTENFDMESFNLKKTKELEGKEQYWVKICNRFAASENLDDDVDINRG
jgi:hypothetical protein